MRRFEDMFLINKHCKSLIRSINSDNSNNEAYNIAQQLQQQRDDIRMQLQYKELDRLVFELEKELKIVKALRVELEKFKTDFTVSVEDEATKKIQEVVNR